MAHPMTAPFGNQRAQARYPFAGYGVVAALILLGAFLHQATTRAAAVPIHRICQPWDEKAADVIAHLVHERTDVSLRQAGDALFRLRRARRTCGAGWLALSCQDYRAIIRLRVVEGGEALLSRTPCALGMIE
jgi:hypothetical protein